MLQLPGGITLSNFVLWDITLIIFVIQPAVNLLCLMGHVFFIKLFKGKVCVLRLGKGETAIKIGTLDIKRCYFYGYHYRYDMGYDGYVSNEVKAYKKILINLGGTISNVIMFLFILLAVNKGIINSNKYLYEVYFILIYSIVSNMIPYTTKEFNSSGKNVYEILSYRKKRKNLNIEEEIKALDEKLKLNSDDLKIYSAKGNILCKYGRTEEAINCYLEIIRIRPDYWVGYYSMACAYSIENRSSEAIDYLTKAFQMDASCMVLAKDDKDFDNIRNSIEFQELIER